MKNIYLHKYLECSNYIMKMLLFDLYETTFLQKFFWELQNIKSNFYDIYIYIFGISQMQLI